MTTITSVPRTGLLLYLIPVATLLLGLLIRTTALLNNDVAWFMIAAGRMMAGGSYAHDFFDMNMPLAIAAYIPPCLLSQFLHWSELQADNAWTLLLVVQSVALSLYALAADPGARLERLALPLWATALLIGLVFLPGYDFGQREHVTVILGLPFVFAMISSSAAKLGRPLRIYLAVLAGVGFYLKPHYAALPFLLLALRAWRERSWSPLRSVEAAVLLLVGCLNAAFVALLYPDWFVCMHWAMDLYDAYRASSLDVVLAPLAVRLALSGLALQLLLAAADQDCRRVIAPFLLCAVYSFAVYLGQFDDWPYHFVPTLLFAFVGQCVAVAAFIKLRPTSLSRRGLLLAAGGGLLCAGMGTVAVVRNMPTLLNVRHVPEAYAHASSGDYVYSFSVEVAPSFPTVTLMGLRWASRYSPLWPMRKLSRAGSMENPRYRDYLKIVVDNVVEDFGRYHPSVVLVDRRQLPRTSQNFDMLSPFLADPRFAAIWSEYTLAGPVLYPLHYYSFDLYLRKPAAQTAAAAPQP